MIKVPGRTHPVADYHLEDILDVVGYDVAAAGAATRRAATADPDSPEGSAVQAATMRAFLEGTDESFEDLLSAITRGSGVRGRAGAGGGGARRHRGDAAHGRRREGEARGGVSFARVRRGPEREVA